jgi:hypothetical protein
VAVTDETIPPALTAEEWAKTDIRRGDFTAHIGHWGDDELVVDDVTGENSVPVPADALPAVIALANAALPDGDPRKITRDDLLNLSADLDTAAGERGSACEMASWPLYAKLAALLPPEDR